MITKEEVYELARRADLAGQRDVACGLYACGAAVSLSWQNSGNPFEEGMAQKGMDEAGVAVKPKLLRDYLRKLTPEKSIERANVELQLSVIAGRRLNQMTFDEAMANKMIEGES